jgi:HNH endonuclease
VTQGDCVYTTDVVLDKDGYPRVKHQAKLWRLNRLIFTYVNGKIPEGNVIGHKCNNKGCINPLHLYLTTAAENSTQAKLDGLYKSGIESGKAKLSEEEVKELRRLYYEEAVSQDKLAAKYKLSQSTVSAIVRNETYKQVKDVQ